MPDLDDPGFGHSVIFLWEHSEKGASGLIINKPIADASFAELLSQLEIEPKSTASDFPICYGGPVETRRGFVLHSSEYRGRQEEDAIRVDDNFTVTATVDVVEDMAKGQGPLSSLMALGCAGWAPGQLEGEIQRNSWLTCDATPQLVFDTAMEGKWGAALASLGVHPLALSSQAGRA